MCTKATSYRNSHFLFLFSRRNLPYEKIFDVTCLCNLIPRNFLIFIPVLLAACYFNYIFLQQLITTYFRKMYSDKIFLIHA